MATYEVSTWTELATELSTSRGEAKTVKLVADIDCNNEIPLGVASTIQIIADNRTYSVTIDGSYVEDGVTKNHVIRNLRTHVTSPVNIFFPWIEQTTIKNIDFINLVLDGGALSLPPDTGYIVNNRLYITNCRFVGRRNRNLISGRNFGGNDGNACILTSCFFNVPYISKDVKNTYVPLIGDWVYSSHFVTANFCWFRSNYDGWTIDSSSSSTILQFIKLNGCYVDGEIAGSNELTLSTQYSYNSTIQNVIDADIRLTQGSNGANMYMVEGIWKNDVRSYSDPSIVYTTVNRNSAAIPESPEDMKNPAKLYADGFDIVVPE